MNPVREWDERRRFVLYKVRYAALALVWLGTLIATWVYWPDLGWPARVCLMVLLALATPSINDLFESYRQAGGGTAACGGATEQTPAGPPTEQVRRKAENLLADPAKFRCLAAPVTDASLLTRLGPTTREFFEHYESIESVLGEVRLGRRQIGTSAADPSFVRIGTDIEHTEVVIEPGGDAVFEIDGTEPVGYRLERWPSIYHWILHVAHDLYPESDTGGPVSD